MNRLDAALDYAQRGLRVFPLHTLAASGTCSCGDGHCRSVAKHPRTTDGFLSATTDANQIRRWWKKWPDANIGIATGSGLGVLDVDPRHGGDETIEQIEREHDCLPNGYEVATGGGGRHLYFRVPDGTPSRKLGTGVDFKAEGGYVVAPPSMHASGSEYSLLRSDAIEPAPPWLLSVAPGRRNGGAPVPSELKEGERNSTPVSYTHLTLPTICSV